MRVRFRGTADLHRCGTATDCDVNGQSRLHARRTTLENSAFFVTFAAVRSLLVRANLWPKLWPETQVEVQKLWSTTQVGV